MGFFDGAAGGIIGGSIGAVGSLIGGNQKSNNAQALANMNYEAQKEFAQNGIRWKVADAKAAGIHPLYALGATTASYSPVSGYGGDNGISDAFAQLGNGFSQGLDRAAQAKMTKEERAIADAYRERQEVFQLADYNMRKQESDAKTMMYKSEALRNYAASRQVLTFQGQTPSMPSLKVRPDGTVVGQTISGQGDSAPVNSNGIISVKPAEVVANAIGNSGVEAGSFPDRSYGRTDDGGYIGYRSADVADRLDDDFIGTLLWHMRNNIPSLWDSQSAAPPKSWLPKGATHWVYDSGNGAWYPNNSDRAKYLVDWN